MLLERTKVLPLHSVSIQTTLGKEESFHQRETKAPEESLTEYL